MTNDSAPVLKEVKPINFLYFRTETTFSQLSAFIPVSMDLFREAVSKNLQVTGPIHWHYFDFNPDPSKTFTLEVALPVADILPGYDGSFHFKRTENFKCVSMRHEGAWEQLPRSYDKVMKYFADHRLEIVPVSREVYVNVDMKNPEANITEIQVGIG